MIIKTVPGNFNKPMNVSLDGKNITLEFNVVGECDIKDDKVAKRLVEKYKGLIWGKDEKIEQPKTPVEKITDQYVEGLKSDIEKLKETVKNKKDEIEILNADLKVWKNKVQEIVDANKKSEVAFEEELKKSSFLLKRAELEIGLLKSSAGDLRKLCEDSGYKLSEYDKLKKKEELIEFILTKR